MVASMRRTSSSIASVGSAATTGILSFANSAVDANLFAQESEGSENLHSLFHQGFLACLETRDWIRIDQRRLRAMVSLFPAAHVAAFISWMRATARAAKAALFLFSLVVLLAGAPLARGQSALDGFDPNANGEVRVVVGQPDGKILLGGTFTALSPNGGSTVMRNGIARLNPDGTLDTAFNPNLSGAGGVLSIALQADGKIVVGGQFTNIGGQMRNNIARLDGTTGQADSFDPNANQQIRSIAVQADGKILAAGFFTTMGGQIRNRIARLDPITGLVDSFDPNVSDPILTMALQADGKILIAGYFSDIGGQPRQLMARLDPTTGLPDSFLPNPDSLVQTIAVQADGKILAGGW